MTSDDVGQAMAFAEAQMAKMGLAVTPDMMAKAAEMVGAPNGSVPPGVKLPADHQVRQQPRNGGSRAKRRG